MEIKRGVQNSDKNDDNSFWIGAAPPHYYEGDAVDDTGQMQNSNSCIHIKLPRLYSKIAMTILVVKLTNYIVFKMLPLR